ncbi:hypothetical protein [Pelagibius marinus]|uniref:hypothetical protein n=1 Tax=Pelagibius marinus TaxID=2762760 RepID=UPI001872ADB6|nr:hypothetical protein [Pelagibius marinus]
MSYILYSSIARAGGIDLLLGTEAVSHAPLDPALRRRRANKLRRLRRHSGQALIRLGTAMTDWGKRLAPASCPVTSPTLKLAAD